MTSTKTMSTQPPKWLMRQTLSGKDTFANRLMSALIDAGQDADMMVIGSSGHGGFISLLIGSVSAYRAEHAGCPVVVVHQRAVGTQT